MNKLDENPPALRLSPASFPDLQPARRLIVLVPESEVDVALTAQKIWELANALESRVQFLGLSKDAAHEPGIRRQLVTLSAMVGDENISVESKIEIGNNWLTVVKPGLQEGDVIVCFSGQRAGLSRRPLNQILESNLKATIFVISSFQRIERSNWILNAMAWAGSIGAILAFSLLQIKLIQAPVNGMYTAMLYISLFAEVGSIWGWNSLFE